MKTYTIRHEETLVGYYEIEAENLDQAIDIFKYKAENGEIDFTDLDIIETTDSVIISTEFND